MSGTGNSLPEYHWQYSHNNKIKNSIIESSVKLDHTNDVIKNEKEEYQSRLKLKLYLTNGFVPLSGLIQVQIEINHSSVLVFSYNCSDEMT